MYRKHLCDYGDVAGKIWTEAYSEPAISHKLSRPSQFQEELIEILECPTLQK